MLMIFIMQSQALKLLLADDTRKQMIRAKYDSRKLTGRFAQDDSRNSMDVSRKQAAMLCFFQIKFKLLYLPYLPPMCAGIACC